MAEGLDVKLSYAQALAAAEPKQTTNLFCGFLRKIAWSKTE